jgi:hypothetical protein
MALFRPAFRRILAALFLTVVAFGAAGPKVLAMTMIATIPGGTYPARSRSLTATRIRLSAQFPWAIFRARWR